MEQLFGKMKEYVKMDTEISPTEFQDYYKAVMRKLTADFGQMEDDEIMQAKIITTIMSANAATRAKRKTADVKKFKKINEKSNFWVDAINYRLKKSGLSEEEISSRTSAIEKEMYGQDEEEAVESDQTGGNPVEDEPGINDLSGTTGGVPE